MRITIAIKNWFQQLSLCDRMLIWIIPVAVFFMNLTGGF